MSQTALAACIPLHINNTQHALHCNGCTAGELGECIRDASCANFSGLLLHVHLTSQFRKHLRLLQTCHLPHLKSPSQVSISVSILLKSLVTCSFCHHYFVKEFPSFGIKISTKIGQSRPKIGQKSTQIRQKSKKSQLKSTKWGLFTSHLRWWERTLKSGAPSVVITLALIVFARIGRQPSDSMFWTWFQSALLSQPSYHLQGLYR